MGYVMLQVFSLLVLQVFFLELLSYLYIRLRKQNYKPLVIDWAELKKRISFRKVILHQVFAHYMTIDANTGYRTKAHCRPFRLLKKLPGNKKRFKEVKVKNFFEIRTDNQGFIANKEGQERNYGELACDTSVYKVLVLGASVSAGYGTKSGEYAWPALLEHKLNEQLPEGYESAVVINSSVLGSRLNQDSRRLQDELIYLNPDLVISYGGGDADYRYFGNPVDMSLLPVQKEMNERANTSFLVRQTIWLPNLFALLRTRQNKSSENDTFPYRNANYIKLSSAEYNLSKIKQMKAICDAYGTAYHFFLQPGMGVGQKQYSKQEQNLINYFERYFFEMNWDEYVASLDHYFSELRPALKEPYQHDIMNIFDENKETLYADPRHPNEKGHAILAEQIFYLVCAKQNKNV